MRDNFTMIPNSVQDASIRVKLNGTQHRILEAVKRRTYGFHEKQAKLSLSFLSDMIGADKQDIAKALKEMEDRRIICQQVRNGAPRFIWINESTEEWIYEAGRRQTRETLGKLPYGQESTLGEYPQGTLGKQPYSTLGELTHQVNKDLKEINKEIAATASEQFSASESQDQWQSILDVHCKVFNATMMTGLMSEYVRRLMNKGVSAEYVKELMLETGESARNPSLRHMQAVEERWSREGIASREEARTRKAVGQSQANTGSRPSSGPAVSSAAETRQLIDEMNRLKNAKKQRLQEMQLDENDPIYRRMVEADQEALAKARKSL